MVEFGKNKLWHGNKWTVSPWNIEIAKFNKAIESLKEAHVNSTKFGLNMKEQTG